MTKALSLSVFAELSNVTDGQTDRQTDGRTDIQNWYSNSRPDAARYALASVAKIAKTDSFATSCIVIVKITYIIRHITIIIARYALLGSLPRFHRVY